MKIKILLIVTHNFVSENLCEPGFQICSDGETCVADDNVCDGTNNCPDGDDELDCESEFFLPAHVSAFFPHLPIFVPICPLF